MIYNETKTEVIENPDMQKGYIKESTMTVHHEAVTAVEEVSHYEILREYPNGGKDVKKIIDVPGVQARSAYDEEVPVQIFVLYSEKELAEREIIKLKQYLTDTDWTVIKSLEIGENLYPEISEKRAEARERINTLEVRYGINN